MTVLRTIFDAVVMLTWSDWKTEPRSNRFHYTTRFAKKYPVYFVQPDGTGNEIVFEPIAGENIILVHIAPDYGALQADRLAKALYSRGIKQPLVWVYNVFFEHAARRLNARLVAYHATEDYLTQPDGWRVAKDTVRQPLMRVLADTDLLVGVSEAVTQSYKVNGEFKAHAITLRNGCDFPFWVAQNAACFNAPPNQSKVAFFQGGVNARLDYPMLQKLALLRSDWEFWFCGHERDGGEGWKRLKACSNVRYFGELSSEGIAELARQALVGLMPFQQDTLIRNSFPLKAYEYVACGLPVITVPIDGLMDRSDLFRFETTAEGFATALVDLAPTRTSEPHLEMRRFAAANESYDDRFMKLEAAIQTVIQERINKQECLNLLLIYDDRSTHVRTIEEHIDALKKYSRHNVITMPGTGFIPGLDDGVTTHIDLQIFDAVLVHYSVRVSIMNHLSPKIAQSIADYDGLKFLFIQDEYENTETARYWIERLGIDTLFTNVPLDQIELVYPKLRFPKLAFVPTLTGYVPEDSRLDAFALPLNERKILIGYRGRQLPHHYGQLGDEKFQIGVQMKQLCADVGINADIEVDDTKRIYGNDWYSFLGSCKATLGTESGANIFDDDGSLKKLALEHTDMPFADFAKMFLENRDGEVRMNQVSPKIFESIRLRTALILFEGEYSGVVQPNLHYIPLKKDYSNFSDVIKKVNDNLFLEGLTSRAYNDVIAQGHYSYKSFVSGVDAHLDTCTRGRARVRIAGLQSISSDAAEDVLIEEGNTLMLKGDISREQIQDHTYTPKEENDDQQIFLVSVILGKGLPNTPRIITRISKTLWHILPFQIRLKMLAVIRAALAEKSQKTVVTRCISGVIKLLPQRIRIALGTLI